MKKVAKKADQPRTPPPAETDFRGDFPDTRTEILAGAATGKWGPFFREYLRPCWRELVVACRSRKIPLPDADDLYQELVLRLLRDAGFNRETRRLLARQEQDPDYRGNLPGRYLKYRELPVRSARFRTYLKRVIQNLVLEHLRRAQKRPQQLDDRHWKAVEPWIEQSVTRSLGRRWLADCLAEAGWRLRSESAAARTRGRRRLFEILYLSTVEGLSPGKIARKYGLDRTTISALLRQSRGRFVALLGKIAGISQPAELKDLLADCVEELNQALRQVHADWPG